MVAAPNLKPNMSEQSQRGTCLIPGSDTVYHCQDVDFDLNIYYSDTSPQMPTRRAGSSKAKIIGIIKNCGTNAKNCNISEDVLNRSDLALDQNALTTNALREYVKSLRIADGKQLRILFNSDDLSRNNSSTGRK